MKVNVPIRIYEPTISSLEHSTFVLEKATKVQIKCIISTTANLYLSMRLKIDVAESSMRLRKVTFLLNHVNCILTNQG